MATTWADICRAALRGLNIFDATDDVSADDLAFVSGIGNRILDNWNADGQAIYASQFLTFTLTPALSPHTIGPTGTFVVTQRPEELQGCNLIFNSATNQPQTTIRVRDKQWYLRQPIPNVQYDVPTDVYYQPDWPNGKLYFFGVPATAYQVELLVRQVLAQLALTDTFSLPPGYQDAITLSLEEAIAVPYEKTTLLPVVRGQAAEARARVFSQNTVIPTLATADSGMPTAGGSRASGTYYNGWQP